MNALHRRATDHAPWYSEPSWLTIIMAIVINLLVVGYSFGRLNARVDVIEYNQHEMMHVLLEHSQGHGQP